MKARRATLGGRGPVLALAMVVTALGCFRTFEPEHVVCMLGVPSSCPDGYECRQRSEGPRCAQMVGGNLDAAPATDVAQALDVSATEAARFGEAGFIDGKGWDGAAVDLAARGETGLASDGPAVADVADAPLGTGGVVGTGGGPGGSGTGGMAGNADGALDKPTPPQDAADAQGGTPGTGGAGMGGAGTGGAGTGGAVGTGGAGTGGAGTGGALGTGGSCSGATMRTCNGACVDIATSTANCGSCSHDCGGGACTLGACQPMTLYTATQAIRAMAISTTEVYFSLTDTSDKLLACPLAGCTLAPRQLATMQYPIRAIAWLPGTVVFQSAPTQTTERPAIFPCPDSGCVGTPSSVESDGLGGYSAKMQVVGAKVHYSSQNHALNALTCASGACTNGTTLGVGKLRPFVATSAMEYFVDSSGSTGHSGYILGCDLTATPPCTPTTVLATDVSSATDIQVVGSTLFWLLPGRDSYNEGRIRQCALPACSTVTDLASSLDSPKEMLVEADGAYVINAVNVIQRCQGATCTGGAQDWFTGTAPHGLHADGQFVYWLDGTTVRRVAK